jgi:26S proteasome non-ATPase regulatory subunit 9
MASDDLTLINSLNARREALETEAAAITSELNAPLESGGPPMGIDTPLVDRDGYPRGDVDVYRVRALRGRLAEIKTDHGTLVQEVDRQLKQLAALQNPNLQALEEAELAARSRPKPKPKFDPMTGQWVVQNWDGSIAGAPNGENRSFATLQPNTAVTTTTTTAATRSSRSNEGPPRTRPFAKINAVAPHSPAAQAGLQEEDLVIRFGNIGLDSPDPFQQVSQLVPDAAGESQSIGIWVQRGMTTQELQLVPAPWGGRGLIGCHIIPYHE